MEKVGKQLCICQKRDKYDELRKALERCDSMDEDYAKLLRALFLQEGDKTNCTCNDVEDDPHYMYFLANTKPDGTSYVLKVNDQNGLPVFIKYEEDSALEIHGVEKDQEQNTQNGSKYMDAGANIEPKEHSDSFEEGMGSSSYPFVPSVEHRQNLDATNIDCTYRKEVLNLLMRPYNEEEYKKLWKDIKMHLPSSSTNRRGKSLLLRQKAVNRAIKRTNHNKDKKMNIMRGFFFWFENLTREDAFQPWEDAECLQTMPGSS